jgi:hypothetical protein
MPYDADTVVFHAAPMHSKLRRYALCLVCSMLAACGTLREERKSNALEAAVNAYGAAIRWGYYETAYGFVDPDKRKPIPAGLKNVRVTGYEVVQPPVLQDEDTATQVVQLDYLFKDVQRVHSLMDRQRWHYDPATKSWWLESGVPQFK